VPTPRTYLDPALPGTLRALREAHGWSGRQLARRAYLSAALVNEIERGKRKHPTLAVIEALDKTLNAEGALIRMVRTTPPTVSAEDRERIIHAVQHPRQLERGAVTILAEVLAAHRKLDDLIDAHLLIPGELGHWETVQTLARDARGPAADDLRVLAAEWTQYVGWLHAEARHDAPAIGMLTEAIDQATRIDSGPLTAQARNFLGYVARHRGDPRGIVEWFGQAYHTPGSTRLQRIGDAAQAAHGYALLDDPSTARTLLAEAQKLNDAVDGDTPPTAAYWLSVTYNRLNLGLAYLALGDHAEAVQQLSDGLKGIPAAHRESEWAAEYRAALEHANAGAKEKTPGPSVAKG
jgi:transcriptional regulator with XRE-family HTH domain